MIDREFIRQNVTPDYKNKFRVAGAKLVIDGSPQGFTAWRDRPYYKPVGSYPPGYAGYPSIKPEQVRDAIDWAYQNQIQILTHANGEAASDQLIAFQDPTAIDPETLDTIKIAQTIKEGVTVYLAGEKEGAHLSRPDERGEHAFSNFIRQATADANPGHAHGADSRCCGCKIAAMLGNALASSPGR